MLKISKKLISFLEKRLVFFAGGPEEVHFEPPDVIKGQRPQSGPMEMPMEKIEAGKEASKEEIARRRSEMKNLAEDSGKSMLDIVKLQSPEGRKELRERIQSKIDELKPITGRGRDVNLLANYLKRAIESENKKNAPGALESPESTHEALLRVMSGVEKREKST